MSLPIVRQQLSGDSWQLTLLARSVDEYLHRVLAEEDCSSAASSSSPAAAAAQRPLAAAAGEDGASLYRPGGVAASPYASRPQLYLIKQVGPFPDVCEALSQSHLARKDETSALVASEWYMRNNFFPGWARPYEYAAELMASLKSRGEEARDLARVSLRLPWWSLSGSYAAMVELACMSHLTPDKVKYALSEEAAAMASAKVSKTMYLDKRTPGQKALEAATGLLDLATVTPSSRTPDMRRQLAAHYKEAGRNEVAEFILAQQ